MNGISRYPLGILVVELAWNFKALVDMVSFFGGQYSVLSLNDRTGESIRFAEAGYPWIQPLSDNTY